ncbi:hypothetical protein [Kitasatospora sp. NPDC018619]|uniref:peptidoglycan-binding domain-containing protein n=1 Tax=unclassified Kitasatospora TaxID=2633591 RepID=UPI0037B2B16A
MPDQHCPTCGTARSTGCGCVPDRSLTETAVLPHPEGPPLVRPYVPQTADQVADESHPGTPVVDPFATTVLPPVAPGRPAPGRAAAPPLGPDADAYATTVLPPVAAGPGREHGQAPAQPYGTGRAPYGTERAPYGTEQAPYPAPADGHPQAHATALLPPVPPAEPSAPEIGLFPFGQAPGPGRAAAAPGPEDGGGRAARRAAEQTGRPLARRKGLLAGIGAALVALTIGVAYAVTPSPEPPARQAQPLPTATLAPGPVDPPTLATPVPSAAPTSEAPSPAPTPTRRPSPTRTAAPSPTTAPATGAAAAPPAAPAPAPTPTAPAPTSSAPAPTPTAAATPRVLQYGMSGPDVTALQQKLSVVVCWASVPVTGLYDDATVNTVGYVQWMWDVKGDKRGVFGPNTRAALDRHSTC